MEHKYNRRALKKSNSTTNAHKHIALALITFRAFA